MRFLLDQGIPRSTVEFALTAGLVAEHVCELGLARASDDEIMDVARRRDFIIVTLDADFHSLLAASHARRPSVVRFRMERLKGRDIAVLMQRVVQLGKDELEAGAAVVVTHAGIRFRRLPLA